MRPEAESMCRCCKCCKDSSDFQQIVKLKKAGLILYRYCSRLKHISHKTKHQDEVDKAKDEVFVFHNITERDLCKDKYMPEFEQSIIKCPRCKYIFDHAKKLLENVKCINKFGIISFCEYCQTKDRKNMPCKHCREVAEKFFSNQRQNIKSESILWEKINDNSIKITHIPKHIQSRSLSDLHLNEKYHRTWSPQSFHQPRIDQLLDLINRKIGGNLINEERPGIDSHLKKKIYHSDTNLNLMCHSDISISKKKNLRFPTEIIRSSQSLVDVNLNDIKSKNIINRKYVSYPSSYFDDKISEDLSIYKSFKYDIPKKSILSHTHIVKEDIKTQKTKAATDIEDMITTSDRAIVNFDAIARQRRLHKDFSFFFVKKPADEKTLPRKCKSSSELIIDTQNMIKNREEEQFKENEKRRLELEQKKLEKEKEKKLLQEKKEKERLEKERQEKERLEKERLEKERKEKERLENERREKEKKETKVTDTKKEKSVDKPLKKTKDLSKSSLVTSKKDKEIKPKLEPKKVDKSLSQHEAKNKESTKAQKEIIKKDEKPQIVKEQNIKEKEVKETVKKENKVSEKGTAKDDQEEFKKMLAEQKRQKEEEAKLKKKMEEENKKQLEAAAKAEKIAKPELELKGKSAKESKMEKKSSPKNKTDFEQTNGKELDFKQIAIRKPSCDDLILRLVKLKQSEPRIIKVRPTCLSDINIKPIMVAAHKCHKNKKLSDCLICNDSELELDIENILMGKPDTEDMGEIIIGQKIMKFKPHLEEKVQDNTRAPILFTSTLQDDVVTSGAMGDVQKKNISIPKKVEHVEAPKGVIRYALSDRSFIDKGWTMLPTEKVVRKMNVYRMRPAHPEFDWFEHNKNKKVMSYDTGEKLAEFDDNGRGRWFYRNGRIALDYYDAEEINAQQRFVIYSSGEPDERGRSRPLAILATFDYLGNGIVFDHAGKIRLKYNQTEGVVLDRGIGPVSHWKWHTLNDPPVLQQIMIDTQMAHKDPDIYKLGGPGEDRPRVDNEEMLAIEFDNFIKEKSKKLSQKFKPFQIKMKALKINEHFSLKVLDQATVYLIFRDGSTNLKINIGMVLDHQEIVDTDTAEVGEVSNSLERFPARTDSLAGLQKSVAYAQRVERARVERERRLRPTKPSASVDKLHTMVSKPLRTPLHTVPSSSFAATTAINCRCRKSASCNVYYDARLT